MVELLRLLLSSTAIVSLHLWKVCTQQQANKAVSWSCSVWGMRDTPKAPGLVFQDSSYSSPFMSKEIAPRCQSTHPSAVEAALHHKQQSVFHSVSSWCLEGGCGLSNAYILDQQAPCSALLWAEYHISHRR